jgi:NAD(P)-dependent dehydrogenase (short-subunit alcohol dehydrogenase family)
MDLTDRVVIVTGAAGNLGRAVAGAFERAGARLVLVDLQRERLDAVFGSGTERRALVAADLVDPAQAGAPVDVALARFGRVDVLCNTAGAFRMGEPVHETSAEVWDLLFNVNVRTLLNAVRHVVPAMLDGGGGKIVNVGAFSAQRGVGLMGAYCAAKSAVVRLTESMSAELRDRNINVNCVLPSVIDTPENRAAMPDADPRAWVSPTDLASTIVFLASAGANAIHGAAIPVTARV